MKYNNETLEIMQVALAELHNAYMFTMNAYDNFNKAGATITARRMWHIAQILYCEEARIRGFDKD